jgi:Flp pilus assembly protein TadG
VKKGQAMVEFALVSMLMLVVVLGVVDFGYLFAGRVSAYEATRVAARYAATHPTAWTNAASPGSNTIEGNLILTTVPAKVPNDDAHITISYLVPGVGAPVVCGSWVASSGASGAFVGQNSYTQATCVISGRLVRVQATYVYSFITPFLKSTFTNLTINTDASALIE